MSKTRRWKDLPVEQARRYLEPGPVVLLSTARKSERAIMTLGWHMMLGYDLVGTYIWDANRSHALARASRECVINLPTEDLLDTVVRIGNCSRPPIATHARSRAWSRTYSRYWRTPA